MAGAPSRRCLRVVEWRPLFSGRFKSTHESGFVLVSFEILDELLAFSDSQFNDPQIRILLYPTSQIRIKFFFFFRVL